MIKGIIYQENTTLNVYVSNNNSYKIYDAKSDTTKGTSGQ